MNWPLKLNCFLAAASCNKEALEDCLNSKEAQYLFKDNPDLFVYDILYQTYKVVVGSSKPSAPHCMRLLVSLGVDPMMEGDPYMKGLLVSKFPDHQPIVLELRSMLMERSCLISY